ncbi:TPA: hypothetical protein ONC18_000447 [Enterobacter kobei]|nr:hypothetical protein [Enterobacter kobei]
MSQLTTGLHALTHWLQQTRQHTVQLDNEADTILARLKAMGQRVQYIDELSSQPPSLGLYGHSQESKKRLLSALLYAHEGALWVMTGEHKIDYFRHVNAGQQPPDMAVRFTSATLPVTKSAPLLLTLYSESEFARRLISRQPQQDGFGESFTQRLYARLTALQQHARQNPQPGITAEQAMAIITAYHQHTPATPPLPAELCLQIAELLPRLNMADRVQLLAPLWGDSPVHTAAWLRHAELLRQIGNVTQVLAPATLLVDNFMQPADYFLFASQNAARAEQHEVPIFPLRNAQPQAAHNLSVIDLASACAEVVLSLDSALAPYQLDIIDIPLQQLDDYGERLQPDTLLICQAACQHQDVQPVAQTLLRWLKRTQGEKAPDAARLIWAISSAGTHHASLRHLDDRIQHMMTRAGEEWGVLQLFDDANAQRLVSWFHEEFRLPSRHARRSVLMQTCISELHALFAHFCQKPLTEQQIRALVEKLQQHIDLHGDLLAAVDLPHELLHQYQTLHQQKQDNQRTLPSLAIDLFAESENSGNVKADQQDFAALAHRAWVNHLRQLTPQEPLLQALELEPMQLRMLCDRLISFSYRYDLSAVLRNRLNQTETCRGSDAASAKAAISEFIAWLGYASTAVEERPRSKINRQAAIFMPLRQVNVTQRLIHLEPQPLSQATHWAYDWLIALYNRMSEQNKVDNAYGLSHQQREALSAALMEVNTSASERISSG